MTEDTLALGRIFTGVFGAEPDHVTALPRSGSNRRYYRLASGSMSAIGTAGEDQRENNAFIALDRHFASKGIRVPEIYGVSSDGLYYLQEDLGGTSLFDAVAPGRERGEYDRREKELILRTVAELPKIQFIGAESLDFSVCHPVREFGGCQVMFDLNYFKYCFLKTSGVPFDEMKLQSDFERLRDDVMKISETAFMYRDFQSRNVMIKDGSPCFIDFQGGMSGPIYYDLASFVWQARARYPDSFREEMIGTYMDSASGYTGVSAEKFRASLRLFVLLRSLQVLGAYGFRGRFERKGHFMESIPAALDNVRTLLSEPFPDYPYLCDTLLRLTEEPEKTGAEKSSTENAAGCLTVTVWSFSYRKGIPEDESGNGGGFVFDCRSIHNPGKYEQYRSLTGKDAPVVRFLEEGGEVPAFLENAFALVGIHAEKFLKRGFSDMTVCFGCTGGQHRSVYCAERMAHYLARRPGIRVRLIHREQGIDTIL